MRGFRISAQGLHAAAGRRHAGASGGKKQEREKRGSARTDCPEPLVALELQQRVLHPRALLRRHVVVLQEDEHAAAGEGGEAVVAVHLVEVVAQNGVDKAPCVGIDRVGLAGLAGDLQERRGGRCAARRRCNTSIGGSCAAGWRTAGVLPHHVLPLPGVAPRVDVDEKLGCDPGPEGAGTQVPVGAVPEAAGHLADNLGLFEVLRGSGGAGRERER